TRNKWVWLSLALCVLALLGAYYVPLLSDVLSLQQMGMDVWILIIAGAVIPSVFIQIVKQWLKN
ncbi:MAG: cation transporting ATPase C-terminal domain-containing protein, partial [Bacteroidota bacterium]